MISPNIHWLFRYFPQISPTQHAEHRAGAAHVPDASARADSAAPGRSGRIFDTGEEALIHKPIGL